jgi:hypothetical protein
MQTVRETGDRSSAPASHTTTGNRNASPPVGPGIGNSGDRLVRFGQRCLVARTELNRAIYTTIRIANTTQNAALPNTGRIQLHPVVDRKRECTQDDKDTSNAHEPLHQWFGLRSGSPSIPAFSASRCTERQTSAM